MNLFERLRRMLSSDNWQSRQPESSPPVDDRQEVDVPSSVEEVAQRDVGDALDQLAGSPTLADDVGQQPSALREAASALAFPGDTAVQRPAEESARAEAAIADAIVSVRQQSYADRLLGDERARGAMTDDEFLPLQEWALETIDRIATETATLPDEDAERRLDQALQSIRDVLVAVDTAVGARFDLSADDFTAMLGELREPIALLAGDSAERVERARDWQRIVDRKDQDDGASLTRELAEELRRLTSYSDGGPG